MATLTAPGARPAASGPFPHRELGSSRSGMTLPSGAEVS